MRRIRNGVASALAMLALAACPGASLADGVVWRILVDDDYSRLLMDPASVTPTPDGVSVSLRAFRMKPETPVEGDAGSWVIGEARDEHDCKGHRTRNLSNTLRDQNLKVVQSSAETRSWRPITPGTIGDIIQKAVCDSAAAARLKSVEDAPADVQRRDYMAKHGGSV